MPPSLKIRNKNAILELLKDKVNFKKICLLKNLKQDNQTKKILSIATKKNIPIEELSIQKMPHRRSGQTKEVIVAFLIPDNFWSLDNLLDHLYQKKQDPFFLLLNRVDFENNIGMIARTAFASGVNGLFFQEHQDRFLNEETLHYSIGAMARIPLVKMNIFEAIKKLQKEGIKTYSLDMQSQNYYDQNLTGSMAFVLGAEKKGLSNSLSKRCDKQISIPMRQGIDSLNVSVSTGIILYEKIRQEKTIQKN